MNIIPVSYPLVTPAQPALHRYTVRLRRHPDALRPEAVAIIDNHLNIEHVIQDEDAAVADYCGRPPKGILGFNWRGSYTASDAVDVAQWLNSREAGYP